MGRPVLSGVISQTVALRNSSCQTANVWHLRALGQAHSMWRAGLAWHSMRDRVSAVFPSVTDLDLRQHNVMVSGSTTTRHTA